MGCTQSKDKTGKTNNKSGQKPQTVPGSTIQKPTSNISPINQPSVLPQNNQSNVQQNVSSAIGQPSNNLQAITHNSSINYPSANPQNISAARPQNPMNVNQSAIQNQAISQLQNQSGLQLPSSIPIQGQRSFVQPPMNRLQTTNSAKLNEGPPINFTNSNVYQNIVPQRKNSLQPVYQYPDQFKIPPLIQPINIQNPENNHSQINGGQSKIVIPHTSVIRPTEVVPLNFQKNSEETYKDYGMASGNFSAAIPHNNPQTENTADFTRSPAQPVNKSKIDLDWAAEIDDEGYTEDNKQTIKIAPICVRIG